MIVAVVAVHVGLLSEYVRHHEDLDLRLATVMGHSPWLLTTDALRESLCVYL